MKRIGNSGDILQFLAAPEIRVNIKISQSIKSKTCQILNCEFNSSVKIIHVYLKVKLFYYF